MRTITAPQGSPEWHAARIGRPTASCFDRIVKPSTGELSKSCDKYLGLLLAEWYLGEPIESFSSAYMARGTDLEHEARLWYSWETGHDVEQVGFCLSDCERYGCSPDGLIGDDGGLELKAPGLEQHMVYLLDDGRSLVADYKCQVQGGLLVTGRKWWDVCSFNPDLPSVRVRVERDEDFIGKMRTAIEAFCDRLDAAKRKYAEHKHQRDAARARAAVAAMEDAGPF